MADFLGLVVYGFAVYGFISVLRALYDKYVRKDTYSSGGGGGGRNDPPQQRK